MSGWSTLIQWDKAKILTVIDDEEKGVQIVLGRFLIEVEKSDDLTDVEESVQRAVDVLPRGDRTWDDISGAIAQECEARGWTLRDCSDKEIECYG